MLNWTWRILTELGSDIPLLVNLMPSGKFLMEDFYYAGGLPAVISKLRDELHMNAVTVTGKSVQENTADAPASTTRK